MSFITLNYWDIALAALLVAVNAGLSIAMHLGLEKRLVIATARMVVQLTLIGLVLKALFAAGCHQNVAAWVDIQTIVAGQFFGLAAGRPPGRPARKKHRNSMETL